MLSLRNKIYLVLVGLSLLFFSAAYGFVWYSASQDLKALQRSHYLGAGCAWKVRHSLPLETS